jgi:hypothetical protein
MSRLLFKSTGAYGRPAQSNSWRRFFVKDRGAAARSARRILEWDFDRLVMGHGEIVDTGAHAVVEEALGWMLSGG